MHTDLHGKVTLQRPHMMSPIIGYLFYRKLRHSQRIVITDFPLQCTSMSSNDRPGRKNLEQQNITIQHEKQENEASKSLLHGDTPNPKPQNPKTLPKARTTSQFLLPRFLQVGQGREIDSELNPCAFGRRCKRLMCLGFIEL